jgi:hypothetical protein
LAFSFFLFPVAAEFDFAGHAPLIPGQPLLVFLEAVEWGNKAAIAQGGETGNARVDTNGRGDRRNRLEHFTLSLNAGVPLVVRLADGDVFGLTQNVSAVAIPNPAQLWQLDPAVVVVDDELFCIGVTETLATSFAPEAGEVSTFGKEVFVCPL